MQELIDNVALSQCLSELGLSDWPEALQPLLDSRLCAAAHGDFQRWQNTISAIPAAGSDHRELRQRLLSLAPWRKGPFRIAGVEIDAEWRSDLKWGRLAKKISPLDGRSVLDVGCGNGYYARQMRAAGANTVVGVDPSLLYVMQYLAINKLAPDPRVFVLPVRLEELPDARNCFDTTFSMGVLYHQRSPIDHLRALRTTLRSSGQLVLETLYVPGDESYACTPRDRYARMRNVWLLPTIAELTTWLARCGFSDIEIVDRSLTTVAEQRTTEWMPFESLAEALDPQDATKTVEGWPAPHRVIVTASNP
jgi:tRNA (mo5U34)-methyltransferase